MFHVRSLVAALILCVGAGVGQAFAQSNDEVFPQFQWNFATPGARANAMGRAFIGSADDASASITNPAGLVRLTRRQAYFEIKATDLKVDRLSSTRSLFTLEPDTFGGTTGSLSFLSVSMPFGERFAFAFTRHEFLNYQESFILEPRPVPNVDGITFFGVEGDTDFTGVTYAGSIAMTVTPKVFVGATIGFDTISGQSSATRFRNVFQLNEFGDLEDQFAVTSNNIIVNRTTIDDDATGISFVAGVLFLPTDKVSVGVQFSKGSNVELSENLELNPSLVNNNTLNTADDFPKVVTINVPNRFGAGVTVRPTSKLMVAFDFVHIGYSSLAKDFTIVLDAAVVAPENFEVDDVIETHLGGEYMLVSGTNSVFVRAGMYTAPNHATKFLGANDTVANAAYQASYNLLPRETAVVGTFGAGFVVGPKFQVDFAYVWQREFVASAAIRF
jgi:long-subunit fatty acid transport protein